MPAPIAKTWTFTSDSNPDKEYETLQMTDLTTSCGCPGWTRRVDAQGNRSCKHTRLVDQGRADKVCVSMKDYTKTDTRLKFQFEAAQASSPAVLNSGKRRLNLG